MPLCQQPVHTQDEGLREGATSGALGFIPEVPQLPRRGREAAGKRGGKNPRGRGLRGAPTGDSLSHYTSRSIIRLTGGRRKSSVIGLIYSLKSLINELRTSPRHLGRAGLTAWGRADSLFIPHQVRRPPRGPSSSFLTADKTSLARKTSLVNQTSSSQNCGCVNSVLRPELRKRQNTLPGFWPRPTPPPHPHDPLKGQLSAPQSPESRRKESYL